MTEKGMLDVIKYLEKELNETRSKYEDCRNELCLKCGRYKDDYLGACDNCRWCCTEEAQ